MKLIRTVLIVAGIAALAGCSTRGYCTKVQAYDNAPSIPPITAVAGLSLPTPNTALKVPEARGEPVTFAFVVPDPKHPGRTKIQCLDEPPPIPAPSDSTK
ncbi:MAG: hypothetical protein M0P19_01485 [Nevskia sp.]|jgi:uncharacterized lipoprotein|nr:hypothetical protein [Nevskia sp.]MCK9383793.1 hypothetical protein [Nevskia sp.]